jgi:hypothetical protein
MNQRAALTLVDHIVEAVADAVREELDDLRAELTAVKIEIRQMAKRAPPGELPPLPLPQPKGTLPRARPVIEPPRPEQRRARGGDLIRR